MLKNAVETIKELLGKAPIFGIGLGHQLFALACGATYVEIEKWSPWRQSSSERFTSGRTELTVAKPWLCS